MRPIVVNCRSLNTPVTGVQRYTTELLARLGSRVETVRPGGRGVAGHLWEQAVLPGQVRGKLLWSPANSGPLAVREQVLTVHDAAVLDHPEWFNARYASWYRFLLPRLVRRVRRVITVSEFSKRRLLEHVDIPEDKVVVIPNGVDARFHPLPAETVAEATGRLGITGRYLLAVGSLEPRKNLARVLQAWERIGRKDVTLVVAGTSGEMFQSIRLNTVPAKVRFLGHVGDAVLPALYCGAVALVYVSVYEGFGLPVLEAMAAGTPVVSSDAGALVELAAGSALLVNPGETRSVAEALNRVLESDELRADLRQRGLDRARAFTWERSAELIWRVLKEEAGRRYSVDTGRLVSRF